MTVVKFGSAGVSANEVDLSGPVAVEPSGVPAGIVGTALKGPAFVPITVGIVDDWYAKFGLTDGKKFGPLAVTEWLRNASALTYLRVLGVGNGERRLTAGNLAGSVTRAGFVVGEELPNASALGQIARNQYANLNGVPGRTYFLGALMSESLGSTVFSSAGLQGVGSGFGTDVAMPIIRGIVMAPSGVILRLSSSEAPSLPPPSTLVASELLTSYGKAIGAVVLTDGTTAKSEFVMLLNGHIGTDTLYPNVITASFDMTAPNYFVNVLNTDPYSIQKAGHYLYAYWDIHPCQAVVTGTGIINQASGSGGGYAACTGKESSAFLVSGTLARNVGGTYQPNYENFEDRFSYGKSPWVISQKFGGVPVDLFRVHTLDAGAGAVTNFKVSIENIAQSTNAAYLYGTFDLIVRSWNDTDRDMKSLEQFRGLSLDPSSDQYIAKKIGDQNAFYEFDRSVAAQKLVVEGDYANMSNYIRVEMADGVTDGNVDPEALPMGFRGHAHLITSGSTPLVMTGTLSHFTGAGAITKNAVQPPIPMRSDITAGSGTKKVAKSSYYWGVQFEHVTTLDSPNASSLVNNSIKSAAKYFPDFSTVNANVIVGDNAGAADTAQLGIVDADRFCKNMFSLEHVRVVTGSDTYADPQQWVSAQYVRNGVIGIDPAAKTRALTVDDLNTSNRKFAKFSFFLQGGFDGVNIFDQDEAELTNAAVKADFDFSATRGGAAGPNVASWRKAVDIMKNVVSCDVMLLALPGIRHPIVTDYTTVATEERFDALYIMDIEEYDQNGSFILSGSQQPSVANTAAEFRDRAIDSSFAAAYYPDVVVTDPNTKTNVVVPPSVVVMGAMALNDAIGHPWFAPAGFTRGALSTTQETKVKLSKGNMDALYDVNINPLVAFPAASGQGINPQGGVVVWGQKTLQQAASALDRVNVRRLLIELRRQVRLIAQTITFEPNRETTLAKFSAAVTPVLTRIQSLSGVDKFKVAIDASTTSQADIDNNTIRGKVFVVPTHTIEYVSLDFVVANNVNQV